MIVSTYRAASLRVALLVALFGVAPAVALDPHRAVTQARLSVWTTEHGLPQSTIAAIVQTRDGYLWLGTEEGVARFDGLRFIVKDRENSPALASAFITSLYEANDGTLWIGSYGGGVSRLRNGRIEAFQPRVLGADRVRIIQATTDGALYLGMAGGGLVRVDGEKLTRFTMRDGLPSDRIWALADDGAGGLWIATHGGGVVRWRDGRAITRITAKDGLPSNHARTLLRDSDGALWIGTDGGGVAIWRDGRVVRTITTREGLPNDFVRVVMRDREGSVWIGTDGGLARWRDEKIEVLNGGSDLPSSAIRSVMEDREGNLWVGTASGLVRLRDTRLLAVSRRDGLPADSIRALLEDRDGRMWIGTEGGGLCIKTSASLRCIGRSDGLPHETVYALALSRDGSLWAGTDGGGVVRLQNSRIVETIDAKRSGLPNDRVRSLVETSDGGLWVSTTAGLALVRNGQSRQVKELHDQQLRPLLLLDDGTLLVGSDGSGLWRVAADGSRALLISRAGKGLHSDRVFSLALDADRRGVWIGTSGGGLARLDLASGAVKSLTRKEGLHDDVVFQVIDSGKGDLWMTSNRGLYRVAREQVLRAMGGARADLSGHTYGVSDGMPSVECTAASPAATLTRDGRIWFSTVRGVAIVDPSAVTRNTVPPTVHVEDVLIDGVVAANATPGSVSIPPEARRLDVHYTGVTLRAPERVRFRYMLEGYDTNWIEAGTSRVAHYTKLPPGRYTLRVTATNEDGVRSGGEARLNVIAAPRWFETWWARLAVLMLLAFVLWGIIQLRLAALRARKNAELARLAAKLEDTNRQLAKANERLQGLSYLDGLTSVANRRRFDEALTEACAAARGTGNELSLILLDLDHFKILNDTQGHQHGDQALRVVASLLAQSAETRGGLAARIGGEEFAWLLPGVGLDAARNEAELLRKRIRDAAVSHSGVDAGVVTASLGVSSSNDGTATALGLFASADAALYRAKTSGRDRVEAEAME